ncbi:MAG: hypothetical protein AAF380_00145, partial [Bacteroidota bacterium]
MFFHNRPLLSKKLALYTIALAASLVHTNAQKISKKPPKKTSKSTYYIVGISVCTIGALSAGVIYKKAQNTPDQPRTSSFTTKSTTTPQGQPEEDPTKLDPQDSPQTGTRPTQPIKDKETDAQPGVQTPVISHVNNPQTPTTSKKLAQNPPHSPNPNYNEVEYISHNSATKNKPRRPKIDINPTSFLEKVEEGLAKVLPHIERAKGKNCVILIGEKRVGKSTLINALYSGIENMKEVEVLEDDRFGQASVKYLVPKQEMKDEEGNALFKVGAGNQSVTTYPEIAQQGEIAFCDCPGFGDTRGGIFDIVNCIAMYELFTHAKSVQLCYLMDERSATNTSGRGKEIKKLLQTIYTIFLKNKDQKGPISFDNLRKLRFVITQPSGTTKKGSLQRTLYNILTQEISDIDKKEIANLLLANLFLIDAKDRPHKCVKGETQDTVGDLKEKLVALDENMLYSPDVLANPITPDAKQEIDIVLEGMQDRANKISEEEILKSLVALGKYELFKP